jgi:hypothetical protein
MEVSRQQTIEILAGDGKLDELTELLTPGYTQLEIDIALENAIAYSQINTAGYLLSLGARFSNHEYQGVYYSVNNNELEGLKFAILNGVDIDVNNGMLLNTSIVTAINTKSVELVKWLLGNGADAKLLTQQSLKLMEDFGSPELKMAINKAL